MTNPLLSPSHLPDFAAVRPEHIEPAITECLSRARAALARVTAPDFPDDLAALERELDVALDALGLAWGVVGHLNGVADTPELRAAYNAQLPGVSEFYADLGADEALYARYKRIQRLHPPSDPAQARALHLAIQGFELSGAALEGEAKARFTEVQNQLSERSQAFSEHVMDATDQTVLWVEPTRLAGVPADVREHALALAKAEGRAGEAKLTLHAPCQGPVLQFAHDRALREAVYKALVTRASEWGPDPLDNSLLIQELRALRHEEATLLGLPHYAALSLVPKMAGTPAAALQFLSDLALQARPHAEHDLQALRDHAHHLGLDRLEAWDLAYVSESLKAQRFALDAQRVREYFTLPQVLSGWFSLLGDLFGLQLQRIETSVWHASVEVWALSRGGKTVGHVYLDLLARPGKRPGAWMDDVRGRWRRPDTGQLQLPVAHLVCNFAPGVDGKPSLLTHEDVQTLLHEWGHGLHHLLTEVNAHGVAGIDGVEWDAVELPSQFMENLAWEWPVIERLSRHVVTGEAMPRSMYDALLAAKNHLSAWQLLKQVEYASFDLHLHQTALEEPPLSVLDQVRQEVAVFTPPAYARFPHSFSHIFAGGYAAGYYSYLWAEVLSADCWTAFEDEGVFNPDVGQRFVGEILSRGGSRPAMESFVAFRGRPPDGGALLKQMGIKPSI
ncbi:M3 family metallopeptidase [Inhella gelatinilytica]|uniref:oligopeptidase A n=1 Tax=Inhella gelatinilytica TaxID=2795030 RepID=A0A931IZA2_9BURK|nr:M3 family metallopeptidase [Inhella gelatinilytica]MBH9554351.1 M3 family metallopeptidase [Inhella gelatinilytica]